MPPAGFRRPVLLEGVFVTLLPTEPAHAADLARAGADASVWRYLPYGPADTLETMGRLIATLHEREADGTDLAFTVIDRAGGRPVGMTRFLEIDRAHRRVEIGGTWFAPEVQRTPFNTESKRLLLHHAFDVEGVHRVQFKTDERNLRSQAAIARIGGHREGVLRDHMVMPDGFVRSSVLYSILDREWPEVRTRLDSMLRRPWPPPATARPDP